MAQSGSFTTLRAAVVAQLRAEIVTGVLRPGAPLRDNEISARLEVSTSPVREAIAALTIERLVDVLPNKRKMVSLLDKRRARDFLQIHAVFDLLAIELGHARLTADDLNAMAGNVKAMRAAEASGNTHGLHQAQIQFSDVLYQAAGNEVLRQRFWESLSWLERLVHIQGSIANPYRLRCAEALFRAFQNRDLKNAMLAQREMAEELERWIDITDHIPDETNLGGPADIPFP